MDQAKQAIEYIVSYCQDIGAYTGTPEVDDFIRQAVIDIKASESTDIFPNAIRPQVAYSMDKIMMRGFLSSEAAIASEYLAKQFVHYFSILSGLFNSDGGWASEEAKVHAERLLGMRLDEHVEDIIPAYTLFKRNLSSFTANCFHELDLGLYAKPVTMPDGTTVVSSIGDRLDWIRKKVAEGNILSSASESMFFCLLTALVFYAGKEE